MNPLTKSHQDRNRREAAKIIARIERNLLLQELVSRSTPAKTLVRSLYNNGDRSIDNANTITI